MADELDKAKDKLKSFKSEHSKVFQEMQQDTLEALGITARIASEGAEKVTVAIQKKFEVLQRLQALPVPKQNPRAIAEAKRALEGSAAMFPEAYKKADKAKGGEIERIVHDRITGVGKAAILAESQRMSVLKEALAEAGVSVDELDERARMAIVTGTEGTIVGIAEQNKQIMAHAGEEGSKSFAEASKRVENQRSRQRELAGKKLTDSERKQAREREMIMAQAHSGARKAMADRHSMMGMIARKSTLVQKLADAEEDEKERGMEMGLVQKMGSNALEKLADSFGKLTPAMAALGGLGKILEVVIKVASRQMMIGGKALQGFAMTGEKSFGATAYAAMLAGTYIEDSLHDVYTAAARSGVEIEQVLGPAQDSVLKIGHSSKQSVRDFTNSFARIAASSALAGISIDEALTQAVTVQRAFGLSSKETESVFTRMRLAATRTGMAFGEFASAIGDVTEMGKAFGDQSNIYDDVSNLVKGTGLKGTATKQLLMESVTGFMRQPMTHMLGFTMAGAGKGGLDASLDLLRMGAAEGKMATMATDNLRQFLVDKEGTAGLMEGASAADTIKTAKMVQAALGGGETLFKRLTIDPDFMRKLVFADGTNQEINDTLKEIRDEEDPARRGVEIMGTQRDMLYKISTIIEQMMMLFVSSWVFKPAARGLPGVLENFSAEGRRGTDKEMYKALNMEYD